MEVQVCIGSVCHLKGSYEIINRLEELITENNLGEKVKIKAAFCLGECAGAVCVKAGDEIYSVQPDNVDSFFEKAVKKQVM